MTSAHRISFALLLSLCFAVLPLQAGALRIRLLNSAAISSDTVLLSHLLPTNTSERFRRAAERVTLGLAPAPGAIHQFLQKEINAACHDAAIPCESLFEIPEVVAIRRMGRLLTQLDLLPLVSTAVRQPNELSDADLTIPDFISVPANVPRFHVVSVKHDALLRFTTVRVAPASNGHSQTAASLVPFDVIVRAPFLRESLAKAVVQKPPKTEISLVDPGRPANLAITSPGSRLLLRVRPLQKGIRGQVILVRLSGAAKTFRATVVAQDSLEARF
jgi:hypothetical protein